MSEDVLRILIVFASVAGALGMPVALYAAVRLVNLKMKRLEAADAAAQALDSAADERLARLEREVGDLQERLDFAERLLTQGREPERLPGTLH
jgi:hypothetical protein